LPPTVGLGELRAIEARQPERQMIKVIKDEDNHKSRTENFQPGLRLNRITNADFKHVSPYFAKPLVSSRF
jgi:hypothetical protein